MSKTKQNKNTSCKIITLHVLNTISYKYSKIPVWSPLLDSSQDSLPFYRRLGVANECKNILRMSNILLNTGVVLIFGGLNCRTLYSHFFFHHQSKTNTFIICIGAMYGEIRERKNIVITFMIYHAANRSFLTHRDRNENPTTAKLRYIKTTPLLITLMI